LRLPATCQTREKRLRGCCRKETVGVMQGPRARRVSKPPPREAMSGNENSDVRSMSFEDALAELERIVRGLEEGSAKLEESIIAYERGIALQRHCDAKLQEAQTRVERIVLGRNGAVAAEPVSFD